MMSSHVPCNFDILILDEVQSPSGKRHKVYNDNAEIVSVVEKKCMFCGNIL